MTIKFKNKKLTASSKNWIKRQLEDEYVIKSKQEGYISRAAYKIEEICQKFKVTEYLKHAIIDLNGSESAIEARPDAIILDLGCSPGSWSQYMSRRLTSLSMGHKIIGVDLLDPGVELPDFTFIKGDFESDFVQSELERVLDGQRVHFVMSDIAPNTTGLREADSLMLAGIAESVMHFLSGRLMVGGMAALKAFSGNGIDEVLRLAREKFKSISHFKPKSSRKESKEIYLLCSGFKG